MLEILVISTIILLLCVVLLSVRVIFKKNGRFVNTHVGSNPAMRKKGIKCVQAQDFDAGIQMNLSERIKRELI